ncbi:YALIA101S07e05160g1_1 [Yarrowia lipolytica]|nr:Hypothetical protein YALI2_D00028g [Yarrowia lipolytica]SEI35601.1 YALIA101S07e05160g1_1 [Yarrowia lipolytica]VBB87545.1 Conserved hypothetical protein [Yarrowia lipolytica]
MSRTKVFKNGRRSCFRCRRMKVRCTFDTGEVCTRCAKSNTRCFFEHEVAPVRNSQRQWPPQEQTDKARARQMAILDKPPSGIFLRAFREPSHSLQIERVRALYNETAALLEQVSGGKITHPGLFDPNPESPGSISALHNNCNVLKDLFTLGHTSYDQCRELFHAYTPKFWGLRFYDLSRDFDTALERYPLTLLGALVILCNPKAAASPSSEVAHYYRQLQRTLGHHFRVAISRRVIVAEHIDADIINSVSLVLAWHTHMFEETSSPATGHMIMSIFNHCMAAAAEMGTLKTEETPLKGPPSTFAHPGSEGQFSPVRANPRAFLHSFLMSTVCGISFPRYRIYSWSVQLGNCLAFLSGPDASLEDILVCHVARVVAIGRETVSVLGEGQKSLGQPKPLFQAPVAPEAVIVTVETMEAKLKAQVNNFQSHPQYRSCAPDVMMAADFVEKSMLLSLYEDAVDLIYTSKLENTGPLETIILKTARVTDQIINLYEAVVQAEPLVSSYYTYKILSIFMGYVKVEYYTKTLLYNKLYNKAQGDFPPICQSQLHSYMGRLERAYAVLQPFTLSPKQTMAIEKVKAYLAFYDTHGFPSEVGDVNAKDNASVSHHPISSVVSGAKTKTMDGEGIGNGHGSGAPGLPSGALQGSDWIPFVDGEKRDSTILGYL